MNAALEENNTIAEYITYLKDYVGHSNPLARLFKTDRNGYLYDTGTNKVLQCEEIEYEVLNAVLNNEIETGLTYLQGKYGSSKLEEALKNVRQAIENENILKSIKPERFSSSGHYEDLEGAVSNGLRQITLELTERCNLRCSYCIYNPEYEDRRGHGETDMSEEVAKAAIDYLARNGNLGEGVAVTFYGGEPLLKFDLLRYCVDYTQKTIKNTTLTFSMTTNLTLMTREIAKYIASIEGFSVVASLDGPENIHDSCRRDLSGNGSFSRALRGLKYLVEEFGDSAAEKISISMVFAPPHSYEKLDEIEQFFNQLDWLPKKIGKIVSYPTMNKTPDEELFARMRNRDQDEYLSSWGETQYFEKLRKNEEIEYFAKKNIEDQLLRIHQRDILSEPDGQYPFNGCCIPGSRKIYITAKGDFLVCERIDGSPIIGNVFSGIDIEKIKSVLVDKYASESMKYCSDCWAINLCTMCYANCYKEQDMDIVKKNYICEVTRDFIAKNLAFYHRCLEENPEGLDYLNNIITV